MAHLRRSLRAKGLWGFGRRGRLCLLTPFNARAQVAKRERLGAKAQGVIE